MVPAPRVRRLDEAGGRAMTDGRRICRRAPSRWPARRARSSRRSLRGLFPAADPPWNPRSASSGTTRAHGCTTRATRRCSARGARTQWNPMFIAPVFTGARVRVVRAFGVGVRQARLVPELAGLAVGLAARARRRRGSAGRRAGLIAGGAARDQLRLRDVEPRRADGRPDGRLHRRRLVLLRAGADASPRGARLAGACALARLLHQGGGGVLRRRARARGARCPVDCLAGDAGGDGAGRPAASRARWTLAGLAVGGVARAAAVRAARTGPTTASTTGRCR